MSKTVWIKCKQVVEYSQQVTIEDDELQILLKELEEDDCITEPREYIRNSAYSIMEGYIDSNDIMDSEHEYTDVESTDEHDKPIYADDDEEENETEEE